MGACLFSGITYGKGNGIVAVTMKRFLEAGRAYERVEPQLLDLHRGEYVVIRGKHVSGVFPTKEVAHERAKTKYSDNDYIVVHIEPREETLNLSSW